LCYFGCFNRNASICNISTRFTISLVNDACKYDDIWLCSSFMWIVIICRNLSYYIWRSHTNFG
ncbi:hypothetical protein S83_070253, partial [Arachis hypogaea]